MPQLKHNFFENHQCNVDGNILSLRKYLDYLLNKEHNYVNKKVKLSYFLVQSLIYLVNIKQHILW